MESNAKPTSTKLVSTRMEAIEKLYEKCFPSVRANLFRRFHESFSLEDVEDAIQNKFYSWMKNQKPDLEQLKEMTNQEYFYTVQNYVKYELLTMRNKRNKDQERNQLGT